MLYNVVVRFLIMEEAIIVLEAEIQKVQKLIKKNMKKKGTYPNHLTFLLGAYYSAISKLNS